MQALEDVKQNAAITLSFGNEESSKYEYNISNEIKFIDSVEITSFGSKDSIILNKLSSNPCSFLVAITNWKQNRRSK